MTTAPLGPTRLLSRSAIERWLTMDDAIRGVETVYRAHGDGTVAMPAKITLDLRPFGLEAWHNAMPGYVQPLGAAGIKWAGGYSQNPARHGLPYVMAMIILDDPETGYPLAVLDGAFITNIRTGASAAVFARVLSRPGADHVALIGAGVQARFATDALVRTHAIRRISVYDISPDAAARYARYVRDRHDIEVIVADSPEAAVSAADIVITVTFADAALVEGRWLRPGVTALSMGSYQEFDDAAVLSADKIVVDSWDQCAHRGELKRFADAGRLQRSDMHAEIGEIMIGAKPGRERDDERIFSIPIGLGTNDVALARLVYDRVVASGEDVPTFDFLG